MSSLLKISLGLLIVSFFCEYLLDKYQFFFAKDVSIEFEEKCKCRHLISGSAAKSVKHYSVTDSSLTYYGEFMASVYLSQYDDGAVTLSVFKGEAMLETCYPVGTNGVFSIRRCSDLDGLFIGAETLESLEQVYYHWTRGSLIQ